MSVLGEQLRESEDFMRDQFPPLLPAVKHGIELIIRLYEEQGSPYGTSPDASEMRDKAIEWFEGRRNLLKQARLDDGIQARIDHFTEQMRVMGYREKYKGRELETPKGIVLTVVSCLAVLLEQADTDNRPLTSAECFTVETLLGTAYAAVVSYREQKGVA